MMDRRLQFILFAGAMAACGQDIKYAPSTIEDLGRQEGVELATAASTKDTAAMSTIRGTITDSPEGVVRTGALVWRVESVEDVTRGVAHRWASVDARWIAVRLSLTYARVDSAPVDTVSVILREQLVLLDDEGGRHFPLAVHDRIDPRIDLPWNIPSLGESAVILFPIPRELKPASLEISAPLGAGKIEWLWPESPSDWIVLNGKVILQDKTQRALWDVTLRRVRASNGSDSNLKDFHADLTLRNVTSSQALSPDPAQARLYTGGGRTISSVSLPRQRLVDPGKIVSFTARFTGVPGKESLELVLPYRDEIARIGATPGLLPEQTVTMVEPIVAGGLRVAIYSVHAKNGFGVRLGILNNGSRPQDATRTKITGLIDAGASGMEGVLEDAPDTLYPGFEERRWVVFPRRVNALRIEMPGKAPIGIVL